MCLALRHLLPLFYMFCALDRVPLFCLQHTIGRVLPRGIVPTLLLKHALRPHTFPCAGWVRVGG